MADIRVPTLGESVTEATVGKWFKQPGEAVAVDEPVVELETDKVTLEVPAPATGVLSDIAAKTGDTVGVAALLGQIKEGAAATPAKAAPPAAKPPEAPKPVPAPPAAAKAADMPLPPSVRKMAAESGIDAGKVAGLGMHGQVTKGDMMAAIERAAASPTPVAATATAVQMRAPSPTEDAVREERVHMTRLRQTIARRLKYAQNAAAMLTTFNEVDMSAVMNLRNQYKELFEKKHGAKLGFMGFFVRACIQALKDIPAVNAEIDGTDIVYKNYYHIGVAVGPQRFRREVDVHGASQRERHDQRRRGEIARPAQWGAGALEVAIAREHRRHDEIVVLDGLRDGGIERPAVADTGRAAIAGESEPELLQRLEEIRAAQVFGHRAGAGGEARLHGRGHGEAARDGVAGKEAGGHHDRRIRGVRAAGDSGDGDRTAGDFDRTTVRLH